jgi:diguanylate cyclase (GGDEF)-like protein/PAS domain S-box-containing protein
MANADGGDGRRGRDLVLVAALGVATTLWVATTLLDDGAGPLAWLAAAAVVVLNTTAVHFLLRHDRRGAAHVVRALGAAEDRMRLLYDASPEAMWVYDEETLCIVDVNPAATEIYGWTREEFLEMSLLDVRVGTDADEVRRLIAEAPAGTTYGGEWQHRRKDGTTRWVTITTQAVEHDGRAARLSVAHDITAQRETEARTKAIIENAADAILTVDLDGIVESVNPAAERMFGYRGDDLVGTTVERLMEPAADPDDTDPGHSRIATTTRSMLKLGREVTGRRRDGTTFPLELAVTEVELGSRTISTVVARDITERKAFERRLAHQGTHDPLTGLPNRLLFMDRLALALAAASRSGKPIAVLFCDLDRFKVINDSLGHTAGDALLFAAAGRFREAVRASDTVARFGGDEFVILAQDLQDETDAVVVAEKLARSLEAPIRVGEQEIVVTSSVGIAVSRGEPDTPETLVRDADVAMYRAKGRGRSRAELFDADLRRQALQRLDTESALRRGVGLAEFVVHYQPEIELDTGRLVGVEALVRWEHPELGLTSPGNFLPVAEETGLIVPIGEEVLAQACMEAARWHALVGDAAPTVWVNVSARQLASSRLVESVKEAIAAWLPTPDALGLEITETDIVPDDDASKRAIDALLETGVRIAIDDFGTGFASLSYLWRFPADVIKIDRTFVRRLEEEREATVLIAAMIQLAHSLGKRVVAEGVETDTQLSRLRRLGCDTVQGYLLARPAPARAVDDLLAAGAPTA